MGQYHAISRPVDTTLGVDPRYFARMGPGTSAATLLSYIPGVDTDRRIHHWGPDDVTKQTRLRINARGSVPWKDWSPKKRVDFYLTSAAIFRRDHLE